ncbi:hypothetical protein M436DRAFT_64544 [Aureobasidium namibiae CBS 147.97]|uniref:Uncharacterized protein n=1 Tax=Aureobasidium namibiae CBS 147.97 TaxID=1043004 RepID=A0A074WS54_9PEZI
MIDSPLPLNISDLILTSLHFLYISLTTILLCLASYIPTYFSITFYIATLSYLCPRPAFDDLYWTLRTCLYGLSFFFHFAVLRLFALPFESNDRYVAPSTAWACAWTVALALVATTTVFVVAVVVFKPLQLLGWWPEEKATQSWVYDSSKPNNGVTAPIVRLEVKDGGMIGGLCECVDDEAEVTIRSLCEDVPAGKTVMLINGHKFKAWLLLPLPKGPELLKGKEKVETSTSTTNIMVTGVWKYSV